MKTEKVYKKNKERAAELYRQAADLGNPMAQHNLALMYEKGEGVSQNYSEAMKWYLKAAAQDNHGSETNIGALYANGYGVPRDYSKAFYWSVRGANAGIPKAEYLVGMHYHYALGVQKDLKKAVSWYTRAIQHGETAALTGLADLYGHSMQPPNFDLAFETYQRADELGDPKASVNLGLLYESGLGTKKDLKRAFELYKKGAEKGEASGYYQLARMYKNGIFVKKDANAADFWLKHWEYAQPHTNSEKRSRTNYRGSDQKAQTSAHDWFQQTRAGQDDPAPTQSE